MSYRPSGYEAMSHEEWERFKDETFPPLLFDYMSHLAAWDSKQAQEAFGMSFLEVNIAYELGFLVSVMPSEEEYARWPLLRQAWRERGKYLPRPLVLKVFQPRGPLKPEELRVMGEELISDIGASGHLGLMLREFREFRRAEGFKTVGRTRLGLRGYRLRDIDEIRCRRDNTGRSRYALNNG